MKFKYSKSVLCPVTLTHLFVISSLIRQINTVSFKEDPDGYVMFCPCMGRFGNQADQFLGALAFAKALNRTFVIPRWVEYVPYETGSHQIPFTKYFKPEGVQKHHKAILMDEFMEKIAPTVWPPTERISFCYTERKKGSGCDAKDGNPFGPYWDRFGVDFARSATFGPELHYVGPSLDPEAWNSKFPADKYPVLAFVGPPSSFPVEEHNLGLQKCLEWNEDMRAAASKFISTLPKGPFIGIHLRNGMDWAKVCELVDGVRDIFSSPQCTGYTKKVGKVTYEMCLPSSSTIFKQLRRAIKKTNATSVFVASDSNHMKTEISDALRKMGVSVQTQQAPASPHLDLAILGQSTFFIGNCISSFSAFVKRERDLSGFPSEFWGFPPDPIQKKRRKHEEL